MATERTLAEERAERDGLPVLRLLPHDCVNVVSGHPMICAAADGQEILVRLFTADEFMAAHLAACERLGVEPNLSSARAAELTRPLGGVR